MESLEQRLVNLAADVLTAVGRGELPPEAPVVRATGLALAELRREARPDGEDARARTDQVAGAAPAVGGVMREAATDPAAARGAAVGRGGRAAAPVELVVGVASRMRRERVSFAAACAAEGEAAGASAQSVRNACTRWLGASAADWQPLAFAGADAAVAPLVERVMARAPWLRDRVAAAFGTSGAAT